MTMYSEPAVQEIRRRAVEQERERCAKLALAYPDRWEEPECTARDIRKLTSAEIAHFIRNPQLDE